MRIQLSDHFTYKKLLRFVMPSIIMMIFTSIYGVVDGLFVSNYVGKTAFAAVNLIMPFLMGISTLGLVNALYNFFLVNGFNIFGSSFFTALNNGAVSAIISFLRTLVFQIAALLILPLILGIDGIWSAVLVSELITLILTTVFLIKKGTVYHY